MTPARSWTGGLILAAGLCLAQPAAAQQLIKVLRVLGEADPPIAGAPARFVIDAAASPDEGAFQAELKGWLAALPPDTAAEEVSGTCVEARCALSADIDGGKLAISGDLAWPLGLSPGKLAFTGEDGVKRETVVRFTRLHGEVPGLGELAPPGAIGAAELSELLTWNGAPTGFSNADDAEVTSFQRGTLADWQAAHERPGTGLILTADLAALRAGAAAAKAAAVWTPVEDPARGWRAGYPAALLPRTETAGPERRFTSADGEARLVIAVDPPMSEAAFDALVERLTEERPGVENRSYTRVNDEMELNWEEGGRAVAQAFHRRAGGVARLEFSYPLARREAFEPLQTILQRSLTVADDLRP